MSRFKWLEFDEPGAAPPSPPDASASLGSSDPDLEDPREVMRLADEAYRLLKYERALKLFSKALGLDNAIERAWHGQLMCLLDLGENPEAVTWATKAQKLFPAHAGIIAARALGLARQGKMTEAMEFSDSAMKRPSDDWFPWLARGEILALANSETAKFCMTKALEIGRNDWWVRLKIAQAYARSMRYQGDAVPLFHQALEKRPDIAQGWFEFGILLKQMGLYTRAGEAFERAAAIEPHNPEYAREYADLLRIGPVERFWGWIRNLWKGS